MWVPPPPDPPPKGWWTELSFDRWVAGVAADVRDARELAEQAKRLRRLRRRVERVDEQIVLAEGAADARRNLRRTYGASYADQYRHGTGQEICHHPGGRVLSVR